MTDNPLFDASYERLFGSMKRQVTMLRRSFYYVAAFYASSEPSAELERIGQLHHGLGIKPDLYDLWLDAVVETVRELDPKCDMATELAWRWAFTPGITYLKLFDRFDYRLVNYIHLRVAAEHQGKGLWGALVQKLNEHYPPEIKIDAGYQCAAKANASIQKAFEGVPAWSVGPVRALLAAAEQAAPSRVRIATARDAELIVELLNHAHGQEEMYFPYSVESLRARLERAPELYSWDQVWLTDNAVVGVWPAGSQTTVITEASGQTTQSRHGLVLDYGFRAGAEEEFEDLLRAWCGWLAQHDHSHLSIFTSEPP